MTNEASSSKSLSHIADQYYYILSSDGCDETFNVYRGDECLASFPFWEQKTEAEAQAMRLVELLSAGKP